MKKAQDIFIAGWIGISLGIGNIGLSVFTAPYAYAAETISDSTYRKFQKAAGNNDTNTLEKYIKKYPSLDVNYTTSKGDNALLLAASKGAGNAVLWLLNHGADVNTVTSNRPSALMYAVGMPWKNESGRLEMVQSLINAGADVNHQMTNGETALLYASMNDFAPTIDLLLAKGAKTGVKTDEGLTPLLFAARKVRSFENPQLQSSELDTFKKLLAAGDNVNAKDNDGRSLLHYVVLYGQPSQQNETIKYLASRGANIQYTSKEGHNLRDLVTLEGNKDSVTELSALFDQYGIKHSTAFQEKQEADELERRQQEILSNPNAPLPCGKTVYNDMTDIEGEAVKYLIEQEKDGDVGRLFCIESITATQKIPLRGNTVIKYRAIFQYMRGYKTQCLPGARRAAADDFWANYEMDVECSPFNGGKPIEVGGKRYEDGSAEI